MAALDADDVAGAAGWFTDDAVYTRPPLFETSTERVELRGRAAILDAFRGRGSRPLRHDIWTCTEVDHVVLVHGVVRSTDDDRPLRSFLARAELAVDGRLRRYDAVTYGLSGVEPPPPARAAGDLDRRLTLLEDERAILALLARYGHSIDYGLEADWVDCFTADGVFDVRRVDPAGERHVGREALAAFVADHTRAPAHLHKHVVVDPIVVVDGDEATAQSYFLRVDELRGAPVIRSFGRYHDRLARGGDGRWRIRERVADVEARHPWSRS